MINHRSLPWILISLVVLLMAALGIRLPLADTGAALLACVAAGLIWRSCLR